MIIKYINVRTGRGEYRARLTRRGAILTSVRTMGPDGVWYEVLPRATHANKIKGDVFWDMYYAGLTAHWIADRLSDEERTKLAHVLSVD